MTELSLNAAPISSTSGRACILYQNNDSVKMGIPGAPSVANTGSGSYAATVRYYKVAFSIIASGVTTSASELSTATSFTPSGSGTAARLTKPTTPTGATHWTIYGSPDNLTFYWLADNPVGTTTYDDTMAPADYANNGGTPHSAGSYQAMMTLLLTALSSAPRESLLKLRSPNNEGVLTITPFDATFPAEFLFGAELYNEQYIARSEAVFTLGLDVSGATPVAALNVYSGQVVGSPMDFSTFQQFNMRADSTSPWTGGLGGFGGSARPALFQADALALRDQLGTGTSFGLAILVDDTFSSHRQMRFDLGDKSVTVRFDPDNVVRWS